jgi:hypothetical protein
MLIAREHVETPNGVVREILFYVLRYLAALGLLVKARLLSRHNGLVASRDFAFMPKPRQEARLSRFVGASASPPRRSRGN